MTLASTLLFSEDQIRATVVRLAAEIERATPAGEAVHLVAVLKGAFMFLADLARALARPVTFDFVRLSSYGTRAESAGAVELLQEPDDVRGRHVLIVEDIVDTGITLEVLRAYLLARGPKSLRTVCRLDKPVRRQREVPVEFTGFTIEDIFVVGYGLDLAERHRQLPYIATIERSEYRV